MIKTYYGFKRPAPPKSKKERHARIRARLSKAIQRLYHNATPDYPCLDTQREIDIFDSWFADAAQFEIEYLQSGGAYGHNYAKTLAAPCNAGKYQSEAARRYYVAKGMRAMRAERNDCGALTGWRALESACGNAKTLALLAKYPNAKRNDALWERIGEYGKLYQWGRGGRTLAPESLIKTGGGSSFRTREEYGDDLPIEDCVTAIKIIESFNRAVFAWCESVPEQWREYWNENYGGANVDDVCELSETD